MCLNARETWSVWHTRCPCNDRSFPDPPLHLQPKTKKWGMPRWGVSLSSRERSDYCWHDISIPLHTPLTIHTGGRNRLRANTQTGRERANTQTGRERANTQTGRERVVRNVTKRGEKKTENITVERKLEERGLSLQVSHDSQPLGPPPPHPAPPVIANIPTGIAPTSTLIAEDLRC